MTNRDHLVEQHILEWESRLRHLDEMLGKADAHVGSRDVPAEVAAEVETLKEKQEELKEHVDKLREEPPANLDEGMLSKAGPMGLWDVVAERIEHLVERIEKHDKS